MPIKVGEQSYTTSRDTIEKNERKALDEFILAGNQGHVAALINASEIYSNPKSKNFDIEKSLEILLKSVSIENQYSGYFIGKLLIENQIFSDKIENLIYYIQKSANYGLYKAQIYLANIYRDGIYAEKDLEKALTWYARASHNGTPESAVAAYMFDEISARLDDEISKKIYEDSESWEPIPTLHQYSIIAEF